MLFSKGIIQWFWKLGQAPECVCSIAEAVLVTQKSIHPRRAEAILAAGTLKALIAQAGTIDVVALGPILAVALVGTLWPIGALWAFLLAPGDWREVEEPS